MSNSKQVSAESRTKAEHVAKSAAGRLKASQAPPAQSAKPARSQQQPPIGSMPPRPHPQLSSRPSEARKGNLNIPKMTHAHGRSTGGNSLENKLMKADEKVASAWAQAMFDPFTKIAPSFAPGSTVVVDSNTTITTVSGTASSSTCVFLLPRGDNPFFFNNSVNESVVPSFPYTGSPGNNTATIKQATEGRILAMGMRITLMQATTAAPGYVSMGFDQATQALSGFTNRTAVDWRLLDTSRTVAGYETREMSITWRPLDSADGVLTTFVVGTAAAYHSTNVPFILLSGWPASTPIMVEFVRQVECLFPLNSGFSDPTRSGWGVEHDWGQVLDVLQGIALKGFDAFMKWGTGAALRHGVRMVTGLGSDSMRPANSSSGYDDGQGSLDPEERQDDHRHEHEDLRDPIPDSQVWSDRAILAQVAKILIIQATEALNAPDAIPPVLKLGSRNMASRYHNKGRDHRLLAMAGAAGRGMFAIKPPADTPPATASSSTTDERHYSEARVQSPVSSPGPSLDSSRRPGHRH